MLNISLNDFTQNLFNHVYLGGHLDYSHVPLTVNNTAVNFLSFWPCLQHVGVPGLGIEPGSFYLALCL